MRLPQQPPHISPRRCRPNFHPTAEMQRQWSLQAPGEPEAEPGGEELCEQEMERLCLSQQPVRVLPYAMVDKRFIRWVPENPARPGGGRAVGVGWGGNAPVGRGRGGNISPGKTLAQGARSACPGEHAG